MSEGIITFLASFLIWIMYFGLGILWLVDGRIKKETALHALFASILAWVLAEIIKSLIPSLRPFSQNGFTPLTLTVPIGNAFPSGHSALVFALGVSIWLHNKKWGAVFILLALGVGIGRVLGNVHSPIDILGGAIVGTVSGILISKVHFFKLLTKRLGRS